MAAGLSHDPELEVSTASWGPSGGADTVLSLRERAPDVDALCCFTADLAVGALHALSGTDRRVPDDIAVTGYDDVWESAYFVPALTTIGFDKAELARTAIDLLAARIADPTRPPETVTLPYTLVVRDST